MKMNKWTLGLAAVGLVSLPTVTQADEKNVSPLGTALAATVISGYVNTSAQWDLATGNANAPAFIYNSGKQDGFNLNVVKLSIEKPMDEGKWAAGYKVDLLFGPDANTFGSGSSPNTDFFGTPFANSSDFNIRQAYVALRTPVGNGLDWKVGVFDSIIGYESHDAGNNPNYTRSYATTIEPHTHTGILASYQFNEMFSASVGIANTFGPAINARANPPRAESYKTYMASVAFTAPESFGWAAGSTLYGGIVNGFNSPAGSALNTTYLYLGGTIATPVKGLRAGASFDYAGVPQATSSTYGGGFLPPGSSSYGWAAALYASYQATEKLSLHGRGEYFSRSGGTVGGFPSKIFEYTATAQYDLWKNVLSRLEIRWDHQADGTGKAYGGTGAPTKRNNYMVAANIIYKF